jgi:hypothetical protein
MAGRHGFNSTASLQARQLVQLVIANCALQIEPMRLQFYAISDKPDF